MVKKVLQIGYEPERDRLTWDGCATTRSARWGHVASSLL